MSCVTNEGPLTKHTLWDIISDAADYPRRHQITPETPLNLWADAFAKSVMCWVMGARNTEATQDGRLFTARAAEITCAVCTGGNCSCTDPAAKGNQISVGGRHVHARLIIAAAAILETLVADQPACPSDICEALAAAENRSGARDRVFGTQVLSQMRALGIPSYVSVYESIIDDSFLEGVRKRLQRIKHVRHVTIDMSPSYVIHELKRSRKHMIGYRAVSNELLATRRTANLPSADSNRRATPPNQLRFAA